MFYCLLVVSFVFVLNERKTKTFYGLGELAEAFDPALHMVFYPGEVQGKFGQIDGGTHSNLE